MHHKLQILYEFNLASWVRNQTEISQILIVESSLAVNNRVFLGLNYTQLISLVCAYI